MMKEQKKGIPSGVTAFAVIIGAYVLMRFVARPPLPATLTNFFMIFVLAGVAIQITIDNRKLSEFLDFISLRSRQPLIWDVFRKAILVLIPLFVAYNVYSSEKAPSPPPGEHFQPHHPPPQWGVDYKVPAWAANPEKWEGAALEE